MKNILEILAYMQPDEDPINQNMHLFQPDIFVESVEFDEGNYLIFLINNLQNVN